MPRFMVKPENEMKEPTAEQRTVLDVLQYTGSSLNRLGAFDAIKGILQDPAKKAIFKCWKQDRKARRQARREAATNAQRG